MGLPNASENEAGQYRSGEELRSVKLSWGEAKRRATIRDEWRSVMKAQITPMGEEE